MNEEKFVVKRLTILTEQLSELSDHELMNLSKFVNRFRHNKFKTSDTPKYGNQVLSISEQEYQFLHQNFPAKPKYLKAKIVHAINRRTGRRVCEIVELKAQYIDWQTQSVRFPRGKQRGGAEVFDEVWLADDAFAELRDYYAERKEAIMKNGGWVFYSENPFKAENRPINAVSVQRRFYEVRKLLGLLEPEYKYAEATERKHPHSGTIIKAGLYRNSLTTNRRTMAKELIWDNNVPVALAAKILGHSCINTTMVYAQRPPQELLTGLMKKAYELNKMKVQQ